MDLKLLYSHLHFGIPSKKEIAEWLEQSMPDENLPDNLWELLLYDSDEFEERIKVILSQIGIMEPSHKEAGILAAKYLALKITRKELSPYEGARKICVYIENKFENDNTDEFINLRNFVGLVSEYEDFNEAGQINFYGEKTCREKQHNIEDKILEEAYKLALT